MEKTFPTHYRKDSPRGITPPNPEAEKDLVQHITKHRGMKTPYTSVSENANYIKHFDGSFYKTEPDEIIHDGHNFKPHHEVIQELTAFMQVSLRKDRILAQRALQLALRAREALIDWQFDLSAVERKDYITWCDSHIQRYFYRM